MNMNARMNRLIPRGLATAIWMNTWCLWLPELDILQLQYSSSLI